ncbi:MAG: hypothetical protein RL186_298, partial [Pseudomonadota bacterium]
MIRTRRTRIVATLGPASAAPDMTLALAQAGVDVFRLNFSHGSHDDHAKAYASVRAAEVKTGRPLGVLADLQGPKLRLGTFAAGKVMLTKGAHFRLDRDPAPGDETRCCLPHPEIFAALKEGSRLLIDDGKLVLRVRVAGDDRIGRELPLAVEELLREAEERVRALRELRRDRVGGIGAGELQDRLPKVSRLGARRG